MQDFIFESYNTKFYFISLVVYEIKWILLREWLAGSQEGPDPEEHRQPDEALDEEEQESGDPDPFEPFFQRILFHARRREFCTQYGNK